MLSIFEHQNERKQLLSEIEFAKKRDQLFLKLMPQLIDEELAKAATKREAEEKIDFLLDQINFMRRNIKRLENEQ